MDSAEIIWKLIKKFVRAVGGEMGNWTETIKEIINKAYEYNTPITIKTPLSDGGLEIRIESYGYKKGKYFPTCVKRCYCKPQYVNAINDIIKVDIEEMISELKTWREE